jgi:hypothetical protein
MNELIRELHDQCIVREQRGTSAFDSYVVDRFDSDKFAKLIVQECAWLVDQNDISLPYGTFGKLIKGHFGVEE